MKALHMGKRERKTIYLDYAATTPVRPEVVRAMAPFLAKKFGNPSALYKLGLEAQEALNSSRSSIASVLNCRADEIVFTAGGSESINLAILGAAKNFRKNHKAGGHIITSTIEHHAVLHAVDALAAEGFSVTKIGVTEEGFFKLDELKKAIRPDTFLVSLMYANNEIGTIEPITEIGKLVRKINSDRIKLVTRHPSLVTPILFHTDACQSGGYIDIDVQKLHVDLLTLNGSKLYGPKQTGCLFVRRGVRLEPIIYGGGQEKNLRSGTENVPGIVGFAKALTLAHQEQEQETRRLEALRDYFISRVEKSIAHMQLNGPAPRTETKKAPAYIPSRLPNNINLSFANIDGEALVIYLDAHHIAAATGSACTSQSTDPSHVLEAIGLSKTYIRGSIRFTLGKYTTKAELDFVLKTLTALVAQQRKTTQQIL